MEYAFVANVSRRRTALLVLGAVVFVAIGFLMLRAPGHDIFRVGAAGRRPCSSACAG